MNPIELWHGDCLDLMKNIPDGSVDMVLCDLPYGTTKNRWDTAIPFEPLWEQYRRICKTESAVLLFAQPPFSALAISSNLAEFRYEWVWEKPEATGFLNSKFAPLKAHENILVFSRLAACFVRDKDKAMKFNPQMSIGKPYKARNGRASTNYDAKSMRDGYLTDNKGARYPRDVLRFDKERGLHPTQKPVPLLEYLIRTYTNEGDTVLDNCMGSGSTGVACVNTGRNFIGMELDQDYFKIAEERIEDAEAAKGENT